MGYVLACDTCLGRRASRMPYLLVGGVVAVAATWWCVSLALSGRQVRRWASVAAGGFAVVVLAIASVTIVPVGAPAASCSSAISATAMRHFCPPSYWDESGCATAGWRRIHQAQVVGAGAFTIGVVALIITVRGVRAGDDERAGVPVVEPST